MDLLTILWILLAVIFVIAVAKGFKKGYQSGSKKPFEEVKNIFKKKD